MSAPTIAPEVSEKDLQRFWKYVDRRGPSECWPWTGGMSANGYGSFSIRRRTISAHRILVLDRLENGEIACHTCDNPICVNPAHIFAGTHKVNAEDRTVKGRSINPVLRGEDNGRSKLTCDQVKQIRDIGKSLMLKTLAQMFGVSGTMIRAIRNHKSWKHVTN